MYLRLVCIFPNHRMKKLFHMFTSIDLERTCYFVYIRTAQQTKILIVGNAFYDCLSLLYTEPKRDRCKVFRILNYIHEITSSLDVASRKKTNKKFFRKVINYQVINNLLLIINETVLRWGI